MDVSLKQTELRVFPDKVRQTLDTPMGVQTLVLSGDTGAAITGLGTQPLPPEAIEEARKDAFHELVFLSRVASEADAVAGGVETVDGASCDLIVVTWRGAESRLCVAQDGKVLRQSYPGKNPLTGAPGRVEVTYADWREVAGRQMPFKQTVTIEGQPLATITVESIEVNPEIEASSFEVPKG
jgi:hypothetical protein